MDLVLTLLYTDRTKTCNQSLISYPQLYDHVQLTCVRLPIDK